MNHPSVNILLADWPEYELLDSGGRQKLERFGKYRLIRPELKAWWKPAKPAHDWQQAQAVCHENGRWQVNQDMTRQWVMRFGKVSLQARINDGSKHVGVFPEQAPHWSWIQSAKPQQAQGGQAPALLNLFGYTGAASLIAAAAGFDVTHVDASRPAVAWARRNQDLSGLGQARIRWLVEDAVRYVRREVRRGVRYDVILLDPPSFGRGPSGQVWKVENDLPDLLDMCRKLLTDRPLGVIMTLYNLEASSIMALNLLADAMRGLDGQLRGGELALRGARAGHVLPLSLYALWECCDATRAGPLKS